MSVTLPSSATELFDDLLPTGIKGYPDKIREINAVFGFDIEGDDGGFWTLDCTSAPPQVHKGNTGKCQCTITLEHEDFKKLLSDYNAGISLYFQGKIRVSGDEKLCLRLGEFFAITRPK